MIRTETLTKRYGSIVAVDEIDLDVRAGDIYGFLGANGSGKTTTVRMLLGLAFPTSGHILVLGQPIPKSKRTVLPMIGALVEGPAAYGRLSGRANLALFDAMDATGVRRSRRSRIEESLDRVGLGGVDSRPVKSYSLGMRQRLGLAQAILRTPRLLILDEPTNGLDPQGIREIRDLLLDLNGQGTTVFLSSHLLAEVEQTCSRVGVLDRGRLVLQDDLATLTAPTGRTSVRTPDVAKACQALQSRVVVAGDDGLLIETDDPAATNAALVAAGVRVLELGPERHTLEEVVLAATQSGADSMARP
ncbi:MAG: ATP-binding cassette domain-containing protein [Actinomycetia bacterium]|nr:ATP-binding cassette domain-containing protein [Actinomycetes bacterium]